MNNNIRTQFPQLNETVNGKPFIYFDNAATTLKPISLINEITDYYSHRVSNIHRGLHYFSEQGTNEFEETRKVVAKFIGADVNEIIFTKGTTESINLIAYSLGINTFKSGDEIITTELEHHANIIPWQLIAKATGIIVKYIPVNQDGELQLDQLDNLITKKTKLITFAHTSNLLGIKNDYSAIIRKAKEHNILTLLDAAQAAPHTQIDVKKMGVDFLVFSAHKMYGPDGVGILWSNSETLNSMSPFIGGGEMINEVSMTHSTFQNAPLKFEAGTPAISSVIAFKKSIQFIEKIGINKISTYENELTEYCQNQLIKIDGIKIVGGLKKKNSAISFSFQNAHHQDLATLLDQQGIALRSGHHCALPLIKALKLTGTLRASFAIYNTQEEIDIFINALNKSLKLLRE